MLRNNISQNKSAKARADNLLTFRILNSLPLVNTAKNYYQKTKESNDYLKNGLNFAEGSITNISAPLVSRYVQLDGYVADKLDYTTDLVQQARSKAMDLASPVVSRIYFAADNVVDNLLPSEEEGEASIYENPVGRIRRRANRRALRSLPSNSWRYSKRVATDITYMSADTLASTFLMRALFAQTETALNVIARFESVSFISQPLLNYYQDSAFAQLAFTQKSEVMLNDLLLNVFARSEKIQQLLKDSKLPKSATLINHLTDDLKKAVSFFGLGVERAAESNVQAITAPASEKKSTKKFATKLFPMKQARVKLQDPNQKPHVKPFMGDQRMPTYFSGETPLDRVEERNNERTASLLNGSTPLENDAPKKVSRNTLTPEMLPMAYLRNILMHKGSPRTPANSPANWSTASRQGSIVAIADESDQHTTAEVVIHKSGEWEAPKHPVGAHKEQHAGSNNVVPEIVITENNPFAALADESEQLTKQQQAHTPSQIGQASV